MLRTASTLVLSCAVLLLLSGCDKECPATKSATTAKTTSAQDSDKGNDTHVGHDADDGHERGSDAEHEHGASCNHRPAEHGTESAKHEDSDNGHSHAGEPLELGSGEVAGLTIKIVQLGHATKDSTELVFELKATGETKDVVVRLLVRAADGSESLKIIANKVNDHEFDAHVGELPKTLSEGSVVVVEVETPSGTEEFTLPIKVE